MDPGRLLDPLRRLRRSPDDAPPSWRKAARSLRRIGWVLAGMVFLALCVWAFFVVVMVSVFGLTASGVFLILLYVAVGALVAALLYVLLAWLPAALYDRLRRGDASARRPAQALGLLLVPVGLAGVPVALLLATAGIGSGFVFVPAFVAATLFGLGGPWLVGAGVRLVRLARPERLPAGPPAPGVASFPGERSDESR